MHAGGDEFEPRILHHFRKVTMTFFQAMSPKADYPVRTKVEDAFNDLIDDGYDVSQMEISRQGISADFKQNIQVAIILV